MSFYPILLTYLIGITIIFTEVIARKPSKTANFAFIISFVITCITRVARAAEYDDDLYIYIRTFLSRNDMYFETGYIKVLEFIRLINDSNPYFFVGFLSTVIIVTIYSSFCYLGKRSELQYEDNSFENIDAYKGTALVCFSMYWGYVLCTECLRQGLAIALLYFTFVCWLRKKWVISIGLFVLACMCHTSAMIFAIPMVLLLFLFKKERMPNKVYLIWLIVLLVADLMISTKQLSRLAIYQDINSSYNVGFLGYLNSQYIFYHLLGLFFALYDIDNTIYRRSVFVYFIGLTIGTVAMSFVASIRFQWICLVFSTFAIMCYTKESWVASYRIRINRMLIIAGYSLYQLIMAVRMLGIAF